VRRPAAAALVVLAPMLLAATDATGDVGPCPPGGPRGGDARIDIVSARGEIVERGTALRFTVVFGEAFEVPDTEGTPLRVDVVLRDAGVPTVGFRYYQGVNRIVRFDAVNDPVLQIVLLPEQGANVFVGAVSLGDTVTMTFPGRLVTRDADLAGLGLERMRWSVIARDERDCDALGDGRPTERLVPAASPSAAPDPGVAPSGGAEPGSGATRDDGSSGAALWAVLGAVIATAWITAFVIVRRAPPDAPPDER
jgi:hypothetical protein